MGIRLWLNVASILGLGILGFQIIRSEQVDYIEKKKSIEQEYEDDLASLQYLRDSKARNSNFEKFGLTGKGLRDAKNHAKRLKKREGQIKQMLVKADESLMVDIFCNQGKARARYMAVRLLVTERDKNLKKYRGVIDLTNNNDPLEEQVWLTESILSTDLQSIYRDLELVSDSNNDSTLMYVAAVIAQKEEGLKKRVQPWGNGAGWSWESVKRDYAGVETLSARYLATMHVFTEIAMSSICKQK